MKKILLLFFPLCLVLPQNLIAQDKTDNGEKSKTKSSKEEIDDKEKENKVIRWNFGINIGVYFANKYPAEFYNGADYNVNRISYVMNTDSWYQNIKRDLGLGTSDTVFVDGLPGNMNYTFAMMGGLFIRYNFNMNWGLCMDVNYTQLKAEDAVTFQINPASYLTPDYILPIPIRGIEERVHIDLMVQRNFRLKSKIYFFLQTGLNMNYTRVLHSSIFVNEHEYSMINIYGSQGYMPGTYQQEYTIIQGGVGYGFMVAGGIGIPLTDMFGIEPGGFFNYNNVKLIGYNQFKPSFGIYLRILFGNILPRPDPD